jgi:broad specificity phosphatase PhoE
MLTPKWPARLVIIRHGQSAHNAAIDLLDEDLESILEELSHLRDPDIPLTDIGRGQATSTGMYLNCYPPFDICFSSPYERARETAEIIVSNMDQKPRIFFDNRIREKEFGKLHGLTKKGILERYPDEHAARILEGKYWYRLPGGENYPDVEMRVHSFLDMLSRDCRGKKVLVVTHQVPYISFRTLFQHLQEKEVLSLGDVPNCGIQDYILDTVKRAEGRMYVYKFNEVSYGMEDLILA